MRSFDAPSVELVLPGLAPVLLGALSGTQTGAEPDSLMIASARKRRVRYAVFPPREVPLRKDSFAGAGRASATFAAALLPVLFGLGGCVSLNGDACVGPDTTASATVLNEKEATPRNCDGNFLSARRQRSVLYGGDDQPRLWTGEVPRTQSDIDPSTLNVAFPSGHKPSHVVAYLDAQRIDYAPDAAATAADIADLKVVGGAKANSDERVTLNFKKASMDFVLKQLVGGVLGLNYVAPDDLGGSITFRTEEPVPKGQVLGIVRDLLARNGLEIRKVNGVYQVGKHDLIASLAGIGADGRAGDRVTHIVHLKKPNAPAVLMLARQLMPPEVGVSATNAPDTLLLSAGPDEIEGAETILKNIVASGIGDDHIAIIPLRQSAPEKVASQLNDFYHARGIEGLTVIPLDRQQAILAATRDETTLRGVKQLAQAMDNEVRDEVALRILPLKYLHAVDVAQRLATLFSAGGGEGPKAAGSGSASLGTGGNQLRAPSASAGNLQGSLGPGATGGPGTAFLPNPPASDIAQSGLSTAGQLGADDGGGAAAGALRGGARGAGRGGNASAATGGAGGNGGADKGETKIVADPSSNSVMIYSSYQIFGRIREVLKVLDVPQSQVVIEATIVEVTLNDQLQQGVQVFLSGHGITVGSGDTGSPLAGSTGTGSGTTGTVAGTVGTAGAATNGFSANTGGILSVGANLGHGYQAQAVIAALQGITKVKVISSPYLTVTNGKEARLVVGDQIPYSTRTQSANNLGNNTTTNEVTIKDTGIVLDITPDIHADNEVELKISQSVSTPNETSPLGGVLTPVISTRSVDSDVLLQSGHTVLLGGLIQDRLEQSEGGVPVLRTTPVIGDLFKSKSDTVLRTELVLLLTPRVTRSSAQMENLARLIQAQVHTR